MCAARYVCLEGTEGQGKTTQCALLVKALEARGYKVLLTKEPGVALLPITMALRALMLDSQYEGELTVAGRELISQAIRSIHVEKLIEPARRSFDFIVQDRGVLSSLSYGWACGNDIAWLESLALRITKATKLYDIYDDVVVLTGDVAVGLHRARSCKQEFKAGDAIEAKGVHFVDDVFRKMIELSAQFPTRRVCVDGLTIEQIHAEILKVLNLD